MLKVVQTVSDCRQCPHRAYGSGGVYDCLKAQAPLCKDESIPAWCPLPNDTAAIAANARKSLVDAKAVLAVAMTEAANPETSPARLRELLEIAHAQTARCLS
jgi:hypothetical protein